MSDPIDDETSGSVTFNWEADDPALKLSEAEKESLLKHYIGPLIEEWKERIALEKEQK